jgi:NAD(P)-dependent dehydrogenase (short-subunit alcohol dehydrogenase family)
MNGGFSEMKTSIQEHENNLFEQIRRDKGRLDVVFANASIAEPAPIGESHGRAV